MFGLTEYLCTMGIWGIRGSWGSEGSAHIFGVPRVRAMRYRDRDAG